MLAFVDLLVHDITNLYWGHRERKKSLFIVWFSNFMGVYQLLNLYVKLYPDFCHGIWQVCLKYPLILTRWNKLEIITETIDQNLQRLSCFSGIDNFWKQFDLRVFKWIFFTVWNLSRLSFKFNFVEWFITT